jgi:hypothetical protein
LKYLESIADKIRKAGFSWGCVSAIDANGRPIWIQTHITATESGSLCADELLTAFLELERITHQIAVSALLGDDSN